MTDLVQQAVTILGAGGALLSLPGVLELAVTTFSGGPRRRVAHTSSDRKFRLAAVVPAHNEELLVGTCVESLLASGRNGAGCEVVVVADNCTDSTAQRARDAGARVLVRTDWLHRGKGHALRFAFERLINEGYDGFLVVDADSVVSPEIVNEISDSLRAGSDAVQARYRVAPPLDSTRKRLLDVALLAFNVLRPRGRDWWGMSAGISGNGFALSRQTLLDVPYSADSIVEDLEYHLLLVSRGKKVRFADRATVCGAMPDSPAAQAKQRARWEGGRLRIAREWVPKLAKQVFRGHWAALEPSLELLTLPLAYLALLAILLCLAPSGFLRWYGAAALVLVGTHVLRAVALGNTFWRSLAALAGAPFYVLWKLTTVRAVIRSSDRKTEWARTQRDAGEA